MSIVRQWNLEFLKKLLIKYKNAIYNLKFRKKIPSAKQ